jgi:predicted N-acetyltransferase YhbS
MFTIRNEKPADAVAREALLDLAYGPARFTKPSQKLRAGRLPADGLSLVAVEHGRMIGTLRLWHIDAGGSPALLLGPLAVHPDHRGKGHGAALMQRAIRNARLLGHKAVILVGDAAYYARFGFTAQSAASLSMPGKCPAERLLALELHDGALAQANGMITATGKPIASRTRRIAAALQGGTLPPPLRAA